MRWEDTDLQLFVQLQNDVQRWRNMHETVTQALSSAGDHQPANGSARSLDESSQSDSETFNTTSEQMTRRLQILNSEYEDNSFSEINVNPSSATSKEYWCRLREAFSSKTSRSKSRSSSGAPQTISTSDYVLPGPVVSAAAGKGLCCVLVPS